MKKIVLTTIPNDKQRYKTVGDYFETKDAVEFKVSQLPDWRWEFLIQIHELIEWALVKHEGISIKEIDRYDEQFEKDRLLGYYHIEDEPGDHPDAPYRRQHFLATSIERMLAFALNVDWAQYEAYIISL